MTTQRTNVQVWLDSTSDNSAPAWIVSEEYTDTDETGRTLSIHGDRADAIADAEGRLSEGHTLHECHDCGIWVEPQEDQVGCGCHCPNCDATL